ncbi:MAG: OmpA family protein [Planctomycetota bacterium]|nr:OmpA family protein [Planctomycetota bacterium]
MSRVIAKGMVVFAVLAALVVVTGCSASRSRANRTKLLEAEIIDARQQNDQLRAEVAEANRSTDDATAQIQQLQFENQELNQKYADSATGMRDLHARASSAESEAERNRRRVEQLDSQLSKVIDARKQERARLAAVSAELERRKRAGPVAPAPFAGDPAELTAMKSELQSRMAAAGIHMPVEIRTSRDGSRRVAVVLPDTFKSGKATLAYNPTAVNAVVRLGQLVQAQYPGSRISVEGHTDADPIRKSPWPSNEALSLARAQEVQKLLGDTGIASNQISVAGLGAAQPIERGNTARAKSRNRRVEIFIAPN